MPLPPIVKAPGSAGEELPPIVGASGSAGDQVKLTRLPGAAIQKGVSGDQHIGVYGSSQSNYGVYAESIEDVALYAKGGTGAAQFDGSVGVSGNVTVTGKVAVTGSLASGSVAAKGTHSFQGDVEIAGNLRAQGIHRFEGDLEVTGDVRLTNADCAEDFDIVGSASAEPGTVMVLMDEGCLQMSSTAYDRRVAGVISGAGKYRPGIVLDSSAAGVNRKPIALVGKVYCKADAQYGAIEIGDLLTTSNTPGHAMKASDPLHSFGAVIGKALRPLKEGQNLIPILVALQ